MTEATQELEGADAGQLARVIAEANDDQLGQLMAGDHRRTILDDVFRRMAEHVNPAKAKGVTAVIHWKIWDRPGGGYDHYEVLLEDGRCRVSDEPAGEPRVTFKIGPVEFLKLVSGNASGPELFMSGKLKIDGDLMLAAQMTGLFNIPKAA